MENLCVRALYINKVTTYIRKFINMVFVVTSLHSDPTSGFSIIANTNTIANIIANTKVIANLLIHLLNPII